MDGKGNVFDATFIRKFIARIYVLPDVKEYLADVNGDDRINIKDVTVIQKYLALLVALDDYRTITPEFAGATEDGVNIDGENYKVKVGDIFTYSFCIKTPNNIEDMQAYIAYDSDKLRLTEGASYENFPNVIGVLLNDKDGLIVFNTSEIT